jgi:DNA-binding transcriptional ArsR family regulator
MILDLLAREREGGLPVKEIHREFAISQPAVSQHLRVLERAGLVTQRRQGRLRVYRLEPARLKAAYDWLEHYRPRWEERLARIGVLLDAMPPDSRRTESR